MSKSNAPAVDDAVVWHDVECGAYSADLALWEELADEANGPILELGCGTGRVLLHLARQGHRVLGLDSDPRLLAALEQRAGETSIEVEPGDAASFRLGLEFCLVLAPMQLVQLLNDSDERRRCLRCVADHLAVGGFAAFAIVESLPAPIDGPPPLPDTREVGGWVYSSLPVDGMVDDAAIAVRRLRQKVSPTGELHEETNEVRLRLVDAAGLEQDASFAGLRPIGRRSIPATDDHVGSTVVLFERKET